MQDNLLDHLSKFEAQLERLGQICNQHLARSDTLSAAAGRLQWTPVSVILAAAGYIFAVICLISGEMVSPISNVTGVVYPLYRTFMILGQNRVDSAEARKLLMYWAIFEFLLVGEPLFNTVYFWLPYHNFVRPLLEIYLCLDDFDACGVVYDSCVKPVVGQALELKYLFVTPPVYVKDTGMLRRGEDVPEFREKAQRMAAAESSKASKN
ncbi:Receptor expression-enhancing protein 5 [Perkinsus olseni]|uniref:Receptor expression-enhancing protein 5 n=2 Tax=Perkinsus olseni TaxID=32597 RepID=A0A7J6Q082_PEROL|nr:Receptor expression-enhancing protein 5 [Perkinsus olseni]